MDYSKLRSQAIDSGQEEEAVTVNTRALIDKVLARYSGEWTTLRELIQNAADANATKVSIRFETTPSATVPLPPQHDEAALLKHTVLHHSLQRLVVTNNGTPFNENDWSRLKRIAEGNPDETKIGAFGVGFYSVFSECENPLVSSGDQSMAFFWKGNSLFTRRGKVPDSMNTGETSFVLDYRESNTHVPDLMSICQFLSSSLTFVGLETLELWLGRWNVFTLRKKTAPPSPIPISRNIDPTTSERCMKVTAVSSQNAQIDASWINIVGWTRTTQSQGPAEAEQEQKSVSLRSFFSRFTASANTAAKKAARDEELLQQAISEDLAGKSSATVFIRISNVNVSTSVSGSFASELERATKKSPPKTTKIAILTSSHDETQATMSTLSGTASEKVAKIVLSALPTKNGRIYIGFPTAQTTGLLAHISAPSLIPTVERENIDLNARYVRTWNEELLRAAGIACRIAHGGEMDSLRTRLVAASKANNGVISESEIAKAMPAAIHILQQFTHRESTPLLRVGQLLESSFWTSSRQHNIDLLSSVGVLPSEKVRIASEKLSFVKGLPVVPGRLMSEAADFMKKIIEFGLISEIKITDIKKELEKQALSEEQLQEFLKWITPKALKHEIDKPAVQSLLAVTIVNLKQENVNRGESNILELRQVEYFVNSARIAPELPCPASTMPFRFTKGIGTLELQAMTWQELQIVPWVRWLIESAASEKIETDVNVASSPAFAAQVLTTISKSWEQLSNSSKATVIDLLAARTVIPTKIGMRKPADSYFATVQLFDDLPVVVRLNGVKDKFLKALGVRKTIELSVIFERLMQADAASKEKASTWSHVDLIKYLVSIWNDIPDSDIAQLRGKAICPAELVGDPRQGTVERYKINQLYEPTEALRSLKLPVIQWPGQWNAYSSEGKFLKLLGLQSHPTPQQLVEIMVKAHSDMDVATYESGLRYFIENHYQHNYGTFDISSVNSAFLPVISTEKRKVARPTECFSDPECRLFGYQILREDLQNHASKLGVRENPPIQDCALRLIRNPPTDAATARPLFEYFAKRAAEVTSNVADRLGSAAIVPINYRNAETKKMSVRHTTPRACFLGDDEEYGDIFDYVDFGQKAHVFLMRCGSKQEPTTIELTRLLIREPARIFSTLQVEKYLGLLRKLHVNVTLLRKDKDLWREMQRQPFLLAYYEKPLERTGSSEAPRDLVDDLDEPDEGSLTREWYLKAADQIVVIDDLISYTLFKQHLVAAPQDETLESLYLLLGAQEVSRRVEEEPRLGPRIGDQHKAIQLRGLLLERAQLFLYEQPPSLISHDVKWLDKHLEVQVVQSVSLRRRLKNHHKTHLEKRSAAIAPSAQKASMFVLSITQDYEAWQVSQEVVSLLLVRPKTQSIMVFEMFLNTGLHKLKARGYNVDRVLKRKQAEEARSADLERQRRREEERLRERDAAARKEKEALQNAQTSTRDGEYSEEDKRPSSDNKALMPGSFGTNDTPEQRPRPHSRSKSRNFFSNITRQLGLSGHSNNQANNDAYETMRNFLTPSARSPNMSGPPEPPPYTPYDQNALQTTGSRTGNPQPVTSQITVQDKLRQAVAASRPHGSNALLSRPATNDVQETRSYCDSRPGHDLKFVFATHNQIKVFVDSSTNEPALRDFVSRNNAEIELFGSVILNAASIFGINTTSLHIYYNEGGHSIAFNSGGAVFFNFRFFQQLHLAGLTAEAAPMQAQSQVAALVYWWVVMCHELAHNLVQDHSSDHSYFTEQFVVQYFPVVLEHVMGVPQPWRTVQQGNGGEGSSKQLTGVEHAFS